MAEEKVAVYQWDANKHFSGIRLKGTNEPLRDNETFNKPEDGLYTPITWTGSSWQGTPKDVWEANQPKAEVKPNDTQQLLMSQTASITQLRKTVMAQQSTITQLQQLAMKQQAALTTIQKGDTNNG